MNNTEFKEKRIIFFGVIAVTLLFCVYQFFWEKDVEASGLFTKSKVIESESTKGGILIRIQYEYNGVQFTNTVGSSLGKGAIGRQYFIQLKPENPRRIVFHKDKPVPDCLVNVDAPPGGWKTVPTCP